MTRVGTLTSTVTLMLNLGATSVYAQHEISARSCGPGHVASIKQED